MGRGGKYAYGNRTRKRKTNQTRKKGKGSDESDEDYVIGEDEYDGESSEGRFVHGTRKGRRERTRPREKKRKRSDDSDEDYVIGENDSEDNNSEDFCASSSRDVSEESFDLGASTCSGDSGDEGKKASRVKPKKGFAGRGKSGAKRGKFGVFSASADSDDWVDDEDEDDDEEFMLDVDDCLDEEDGNRIRKKSGVRSRVSGRKGSSKSGKTKRKLKKSKTKKKKKKISRGRQRKLGLKKVMSSDDDFLVEDRVVPEKKKKKKNRKIKKKAIAQSDSDFEDSGSSNFEYNVSEEERDFIRELVSNGNFTTSLTSSSPMKHRKKGRGRKRERIVHSDSDFVVSGSSDFEYRVSEEERELAHNRNTDTCLSSLPNSLKVDVTFPCQRQRSIAKKGKEKVDDLQLDMGKQVCGICLSEEQRGIVRGTLNSCLHYFCFACIMEWSKVESRCPVCKQRFRTISKPARLNTGIGLKKTVITVPKRDQVYRPSEEELRSYLDPYENVVCLECHQGGDDSLMLLCDLCDSPAHTYCVGLGREVPEGNWYCEGCKSSEPASSNSHVQNFLSDQNTSNGGLCTEESSTGIDAEVFETYLPPYSTSQHPVSLPEQLFSPRTDLLLSPRYPGGEDIQVESPLSGAGAATVSGRRRLRRQIHNMISTSRMSQFTEVAERNNGMPNVSTASNVATSKTASNVATSKIEKDQVTVENVNSLGSGDICQVAAEGKVQSIGRSSNCCGESPSYSVQNGDAFSARIGHMKKQVIHDLNATPPIGPADHSLSAGQEGTSYSVLDHDQCCQPIVRSSAYIFPCTTGEDCSSHAEDKAKEQVQLMVKRHLKLLSRDTELEHRAFKDIARCSTHTILAGCGFKHNSSTIVSMEPPSGCSHAEKEGRQMDLVRGCCSCCFDSFVRDVVLEVIKMKQ